MSPRCTGERCTKTCPWYRNRPMSIGGLLLVAAVVASPVVFLIYGAFPAFVLLAAVVLLLCLDVLQLALEYDAALAEYWRRLENLESRDDDDDDDSDYPVEP